MQSAQPPVRAVAADAADDGADWALLAGDLGRVFDLEPVVDVLPDGIAPGRAADQLLARAALVAGPVLVLPSRPARRRPRGAIPAEEGAGAGQRARPASGIRRVLIASDGSDEVAAGARTLRRRLVEAGVQSTVLHVLTEDNRPRMWEGSGHHASVWFDELRRRHGATPEALRVVTGEPAHELRAYAASADLVVMLWRHAVTPGRSSLLRSVLVQGIDIPHLLVPLVCLEALAWRPDVAMVRRSTDP
ncbi:MAG TPA: universal stress protein [Acidimicrobiales bacterium]|nr:universal stress protein [Acidimicrobiales bacterium]